MNFRGTGKDQAGYGKGARHALVAGPMVLAALGPGAWSADLGVFGGREKKTKTEAKTKSRKRPLRPFGASGAAAEAEEEEEKKPWGAGGLHAGAAEVVDGVWPLVSDASSLSSRSAHDAGSGVGAGGGAGSSQRSSQRSSQQSSQRSSQRSRRLRRVSIRLTAGEAGPTLPIPCASSSVGAHSEARALEIDRVPSSRLFQPSSSAWIAYII